MSVDICIVSWKDKERKIKETDIKSNGDDGGEWKETETVRFPKSRTEFHVMPL